MKKLLPIFLAILSVSAFAQYPIGNRTITYEDGSRNRDIECEIYYPGVSAGSNVDVAVGEFPVIVFGHGFSMQVGAYPNWREEFVPDGYIMVFPTTEGSPFTPNHGEFGLDLRFLVTRMQAEGQDNSSPFNQHISERAGMMGHSMGGGATFIGASSFAGVNCVVGLAPAETTPSAVTAAESVTAPTMVLSGTSDGVTPPANHHIPIYDALGSDCKYFVKIEEGSHCHYASNSTICPLGELFTQGSLPAEDQRQVSYAVCHPWFDYFLKDDCSAWDEFETALTTESDLGTITSACDNTEPIISDNGGTLESNSQIDYQWYLNGNEITNAEQQTYAYTQSGTYQVGATVLGNCPTLSNEIVVQITGIVEREINLSAWGNEIKISSRDQLDSVTLEWFDVSGKLISSNSFSSVPTNELLTIEKPNFVGVKLLRLRSNQTTKTWKLF
jgi:pimeloyl-ACP methyl ester carboxylesterase